MVIRQILRFPNSMHTSKLTPMTQRLWKRGWYWSVVTDHSWARPIYPCDVILGSNLTRDRPYGVDARTFITRNTMVSDDLFLHRLTSTKVDIWARVEGPQRILWTILRFARRSIIPDFYGFPGFSDEMSWPPAFDPNYDFPVATNVECRLRILLKYYISQTSTLS